MDGGHYLAPTRDPSAAEMRFFMQNPQVPAYAAEDGRVVVNPYSRLSPEETQAVIRNESARIFMRQDHSARPTRENFPLTEQQRQTPYPAYGPPNDPQQSLRETMAARVLTNDPSAGQPTPEQRRFADELRARMQAARATTVGGGR